MRSTQQFKPKKKLTFFGSVQICESLKIPQHDGPKVLERVGTVIEALGRDARSLQDDQHRIPDADKAPRRRH